MIDMVDNGLAAACVLSEDNILSVFTSKIIRVGLGDSPLGYTKILAYVRPEDKVKYSDKRTWSSLRVGNVAGADTLRYANMSGSKEIIDALMGFIVGMLASHRFDIIVISYGVVERQVNQQKPEAVSLDATIDLIPLYHVLPPKYDGTETEKRIKEAFIKTRAGILGLFPPEMRAKKRCPGRRKVR